LKIWFWQFFRHQVGDHIEKIDGESLVGCRHYEVATNIGEKYWQKILATNIDNKY